MLVDRYPPMSLFALVPELVAEFEPVLRELDRLLDDDEIFHRVKADLARRAPHSLTRGRPGTPVEVVLRLLVVKRLYGWSYEEVERFVADSLVLRQFCRVYLERVPDDTTLLRWANLIEPATLAALNERVVALARGLKVTRGRKLRVDSTVVETTIHHPSDSGLLGDGVRVLSRLLRRARAVLGEAAAAGVSRGVFRTRTRSVRRLAQRLHRLARRKGAAAAEEMRRAYARVIGVARRSRDQAAAVCAALRARSEATAQRLVRQFETFLPRVERAIAQTVRRVLKGEAVPAAEKIVSLFEPHTRIIVRHKAGKPVEFGRKLWLEEVEGGIVSGWRLLEAPGQDAPQLVPSLAAHRQRFGKPPRLLTADRGVFSPRNEAQAERAGVRRVAIPAAGRASGTPERIRAERRGWFRRGLRFRAGIEGRISVLQRCYGLDRCRDHGERGMGRWVGWGIVTANLGRIARTVAAREQAQAA
jgi:transposase, IS5 family